MADPATIVAAISAASKIGGAILGKAKAPEAIPLEPVDFEEASQEALGVNLGNLSEIEQLVKASGSITREETATALEELIPGFGNLRDKLMGFATDLTENPYELPSEIVDQLARVSAERGLQSGVDVRSGVGSFDLLRNLGLTSLEFGRSRIADATQIFGQVRAATPIYNPLNPASLFVTPQEVTQQRGRENEINQAILQGGENAKVATSNFNRAQVVGAVQSSLGGMTSALQEAGFFGSGTTTGGGGGVATMPPILPPNPRYSPGG